MANLAENNVLIMFPEDFTLEQKHKVLAYFDEEIALDIRNDPEILDDGTVLELCYDTKWTEQRKLLQQCANLFDINIIGTCHEWGNQYVSSFNINRERNKQ